MRRNVRGFTLVEMLVAVVILVITITSTARFAAGFSREMARSSVRMVATGVATGQVELVRADPRYNQLVTLYNSNNVVGFPGYPSMRRTTRVVRDQSGSPARDRTTVTVRVTDPALRDTVSVSVVVAAP